MTWRVPAAIAVFALLAWIGYEIGRAGADLPTQRIQQPSTMEHGRLSGKRIDGRSWSLDYDTVSLSPDGTIATIAHVRDGRIHRAGKSDVRLQADDVTVNTVTNDLQIRGPVTFTDPISPTRTRTFTTRGAQYTGTTRTLVLAHPAKITEGGATVTVANATVNFLSGDAKLGPIEGDAPALSP
ncbi:MAG: LPS export ABC transporter periplasmic protein LptC [Candidatus Eremiobacteraeota bacterium]|nr:LPS export ABC transporter periplasmic protein LptC [Candidatus Eremiobacteraeota bacterium]